MIIIITTKIIAIKIAIIILQTINNNKNIIQYNSVPV